MALSKDKDKIVKAIARGNQKGIVVSRGFLVDFLRDRFLDFDSALKTWEKEHARNRYVGEKPQHGAHFIAMLDIIDYITEMDSEVVELNFSYREWNRIPTADYRNNCADHNPIFYSILSRQFERTAFERRLHTNHYNSFSAGQLTALKTNSNYYKMGLIYPPSVLMTEYANVRARALK